MYTPPDHANCAGRIERPARKYPHDTESETGALNAHCKWLLPVILALLPGCLAAPSYDGPTSSHYDGRHFVNTQPMDKSAWDMIKLGWGALTTAEDWPSEVEVNRQIIPMSVYTMACRSPSSITPRS